MNKKYDVSIIGSGPGGYVAAIRAAMLGLSVCLIEKEELGGVCLNWGCIPTKALLRTVHLLQGLKGFDELGINIKTVGIDFERIIQRKEKVVRGLQKGVAYLLKKHAVDVIKGQAKIVDENNLEVENQRISFRSCIIATGSRPADLPQMRIDEDTGILSNKGILNLKTIPQSLIIIGGGIIGCEFADIFNTLGTEVKILELTEQILPQEDIEAANLLKRELRKRGVNIYNKTSVRAIKKNSDNKFEVSFNETENFSADKILMAIGRIPNTDNSGIKNVGIKIDKGRIIVNEFMQTSISNFYAIGDVVGKTFLAHVASREGIIAAENIAGLSMQMNYDFIPRCVYTNPEIASVGLTQKQAQANGMKVKIGTFPLTANSKAIIEQSSEGFVKFIAGENKRILGAVLCGYGACEIIHEIVVAMQAGLNISQLQKIIHAHPSVSEAIMEAAAAVDARAIHSI